MSEAARLRRLLSRRYGVSVDAAELVLTREFYDAVAPSYARLLPDTSYEDPTDLAFVDRFISLLPASNAAVLDAGCGAGRMIDYLRAHRVARVDGVDISPEMVARASTSRPDSCVAVGDIAALPFGDDRFDGVLSWYSIIHTAPGDCAVVIAEFGRVLAPGGLLLLAFQAGTGEREIGKGYGGDRTLRAQLHRSSRLADLIAGEGFELLASSERAPRPEERHAQGFVLARKGGTRADCGT